MMEEMIWDGRKQPFGKVRLLTSAAAPRGLDWTRPRPGRSTETGLLPLAPQFAAEDAARDFCAEIGLRKAHDTERGAGCGG
jgi:hypothetical protein